MSERLVTRLGPHKLGELSKPHFPSLYDGLTAFVHLAGELGH